MDLPHQIVHLTRRGPKHDQRVNQPRGTDDLLHRIFAQPQLIGRRGGADIDGLVLPGAELLKQQRAVVIGAGQAEAIIDQAFFARAVAVVHGADLRHGDMAFVDEHQKILGKVVQKGIRRVAGLAAVKVAAVVFDARAKADLAHHFDIIARALAKPHSIERLALVLQLLGPHLQIPLDLVDVFVHLFAVHGIMCCGKDHCVLQRAQHVAADHLDLADAVNLVAEKFNTQGVLALIGGDDLQHVAMHTEAAAGKFIVIARILNFHQALDQLVPADLHAGTHADHHALILAGIAHGIDARHAGNDDHIAALTHGSGGRVAQPVDLLVDGGILFDVGIGGGDVGFGLVVIVIADEILHCAVRKKGAQLAAQLGRQRLVMRQDQSGLLHLFNDGRHGKGLSAAGDTQQHLVAFSLQNASGQRFNGRGLVAAGRIGGFEHKAVHGKRSFRKLPSDYSMFPRRGTVRPAGPNRFKKNFHHPPFLFAARRPYASKTRFPAG